MCFPLYRMATPVSDEGAFKTPKAVRVKSIGSNGGTPVTIPASPFMKKLGCGTGVNVYLMNRYVVTLIYSSLTIYFVICSLCCAPDSLDRFCSQVNVHARHYIWNIWQGQLQFYHDWFIKNTSGIRGHPLKCTFYWKKNRYMYFGHIPDGQGEPKPLLKSIKSTWCIMRL